MFRRTLVTNLVLLLAGAACTGSGSDIGPRLSRLPDASCKVVVLDDQGRGVVGAAVQIGASSTRAVTGRNGRGDFVASPRGRVLLHVDGAAAAAVASDRLAELSFATTIQGPDIASPVYLPDLPDSASATLSLGNQVSSTAITSVAGAQLTIGAGKSIGWNVGSTEVAIRLGDLSPQHLPGDLPGSDSGTILFSRGVWIDPVDVTFAAPVDLDVADELAIGTGSAVLYRLDPLTGEWGVQPVTVTVGGGRITATGGIDAGGCYAFGVEVASTTVSGRVLDAAATPRAVLDAMVMVDQHPAKTGGDGRFVVQGVPAVLADGSPRQAAIELFAGGSWLPARSAVFVPVTTAALDVGDLTLDTLLAGNIRVQQVVRGRGDPGRPARLSTGLGDVALTATSDSLGQVTFEDVPTDYFGYQSGRSIDSQQLYYSQAIAFLERGRRWLDSYQFEFQRPWFIGGRTTRTLVTDAIGGGPVFGAGVVQGGVAGEGFVGLTREAGLLFVTRDYAGRATASISSQRDGETIVHAISIINPNGEHIELPLRRVLRQPLGAFDRHGIVVGDLIGADAAREHSLRVTRRINLQEWWDEVVEGVPLPSSLPIDLDPATTHGPFRAGVDANGGNLAAIEYTTPSGDRTLQKVAVVADFVPAEGAVVARDLPLQDVGGAFAVAGLLDGADADFDASQLTMDIALRLPSGLVVDVARDLRGNRTITGNGVSFALPALSDTFAEDQWLALLRSSYASGNFTLGYAGLVTLPSTGNAALGSFPGLSQPAPNATVAASGFHVQLALPAAAAYGTIELRSQSAGETLLWQVYVPRILTDFDFVTLPTDAVTPLVAGKTYTLTVSAYFGDSVLATSNDPYRDVTTFLQSIGSTDRGVTQVSRRSITITTN